MVTIAIPTYSRLHYLKEAVASALAQTYEHIEILIGDDGNNPEIQHWSEEQASRSTKIRYQKNARNLGLAGNWNALTDIARGKYIVIIGDDDRLLPDYVKKCIEAILPDGALVFSNQVIINQKGQRLDYETQEYPKLYGRDKLPAGWLSAPEACVWQNSVPISAAMIRTADVRRLRFKEDLNNPEIEFFARLAREGAKFAFIPEYLAEYRVHPQSATSGGLKSDRLVEYLMEIQVRPEVEMHKARFLSGLMVNAVSRCLIAGEPERANLLFDSQYYPRFERQRFRGRIQRISLVLPGWLGIRFYRLTWKLKKAVGKITCCFGSLNCG